MILAPGADRLPRPLGLRPRARPPRGPGDPGDLGRLPGQGRRRRRGPGRRRGHRPGGRRPGRQLPRDRGPPGHRPRRRRSGRGRRRGRTGRPPPHRLPPRSSSRRRARAGLAGRRGGAEAGPSKGRGHLGDGPGRLWPWPRWPGREGGGIWKATGSVREPEARREFDTCRRCRMSRALGQFEGRPASLDAESTPEFRGSKSVLCTDKEPCRFLTRRNRADPHPSRSHLFSRPSPR